MIHKNIGLSFQEKCSVTLKMQQSFSGLGFVPHPMEGVYRDAPPAS